MDSAWQSRSRGALEEPLLTMPAQTPSLQVTGKPHAPSGPSSILVDRSFCDKEAGAAARASWVLNKPVTAVVLVGKYGSNDRTGIEGGKTWREFRVVTEYQFGGEFWIWAAILATTHSFSWNRRDRSRQRWRSFGSWMRRKSPNRDAGAPMICVELLRAGALLPETHARHPYNTIYIHFSPVCNNVHHQGQRPYFRTPPSSLLRPSIFTMAFTRNPVSSLAQAPTSGLSLRDPRHTFGRRS